MFSMNFTVDKLMPNDRMTAYIVCILLHNYSRRFQLAGCDHDLVAGQMTAISCVVVSSQRRHEPSKTWRVSDEQGQNNSDVQHATTLLLVMTCLIAKTEVLWCSSARRQFQIPIGPVRVGNTSVLRASAVRDLGST